MEFYILGVVIYLAFAFFGWAVVHGAQKLKRQEDRRDYRTDAD